MIAPAADLAGMVTLGTGAAPAAANELRAGVRYPFPKDFPNVVVQQPPNSAMRIREHPDHPVAKAGDADAAMRVVNDADQ